MSISKEEIKQEKISACEINFEQWLNSIPLTAEQRSKAMWIFRDLIELIEE